MGMMFRRNKLRRREMEAAEKAAPPVKEPVTESVKGEVPETKRRGRKPKK